MKNDKLNIYVSGIFSFLNKNRTLNGFALLAGLFLLLAIFSNFSAYAFDVYFNSDTLYLPSVYKDLFVDKHKLTDWHLNPAPNFFPDMMLYFVMLFFSSGNFIVVSFVFSFIQFFSIILLFRHIFKLVMPAAYAGYFGLLFLLFSFCVLEYLFLGKDFMYTFYVLSNSYHTGAFVMSLVALSLFLKYISDRYKKRLVILFILSVVCVASDKLFIVLFSLPAFITTLFFYKKTGTKTALLVSALLALSVFTGIKLFEFLEDSDFTEFDKPYKMWSFENIRSSLDILLRQVSIYMSEFSFKGMTLYLFFTGLIARIVLFFCIRQRENRSVFCQYLFFSICFDIIVFLAPVLNGSYTGFDTLRYNIFPLYVSALNNTLLVAWLVSTSALKKYAAMGKSISTVFVLLLAFKAVFSFNAKGLKHYFSYYPPMARQIDALTEQHHLKCGVSEYWNAKKNTLFSKKNVKIYSVYDNLAVYGHVTNRQWFFGDNVFNYVVVNKLSDTLFFHSYFKTIQPIPLGEEAYLIKTPEFTYDRSAGDKPVVMAK